MEKNKMQNWKTRINNIYFVLEKKEIFCYYNILLAKQ